MQLTTAPDATILPTIQNALQEQRVLRYMTAACQDNELAFKMYLWNCDLSQAFYLPLHICEIVCRNAMHQCLINRLGENWYEHSTFRKILDSRFLSELDIAVADEKGQHGGNMTNHHVVSALTFGFWEHLATKRFDRLLWLRGINHSFPGAHNKRLGDLHEMIEKARRWRNRIAHHRAIFDKGPAKKHQEIVELIRWACADTADWIESTSHIQTIINLRPDSN